MMDQNKQMIRQQKCFVNIPVFLSPAFIRYIVYCKEKTKILFKKIASKLTLIGLFLPDLSLCTYTELI